MDYHKTDKRIEDYVIGLFGQMHSPTLVFHNLKHTQTVVKRTKEIAGHYSISENDMLALFAASWFHDTGYLFTEPERHEEMSCEIMKKFMKEFIDEEQLVSTIEDCIMATKSPRNPETLLQQIICDADTFHLGTKEFGEMNKKAYKEAKERNPDVDKPEFNKGTLEMMQRHQFYTSYCKDLLEKRKRKNIKWLGKNINKEVNIESQEQIDLSKVEKDKSKLMSKGIQTMLRVTSKNHLMLSEMADKKANILISVNSIIIGVILSVLLRKLTTDTYLIIPTALFLLCSVSTIVLAIIATRPQISGGTFTKEAVKEKKINLLFFGNFYKASYEDYNEAMRELMTEPDYLYGSLIKDIYYLGRVLGRKYRLIRLAFNVFMIGIVVSVIAFAVATLFAPESAGAVINGSGSPLVIFAL